MKLSDKLHMKCRQGWGVVKDGQSVHLKYDPFGITGFPSLERALDYMDHVKKGEL